MTREHRLVLSLDEIKAVRWQCPKCNVAVTYALNESIHLPEQCPSCHEPLLGEIEKAGDAGQEFIRALKAVLHHKPALIHLEFVDESVTRR